MHAICLMQTAKLFNEVLIRLLCLSPNIQRTKAGILSMSCHHVILECMKPIIPSDHVTTCCPGFT